MLHRQRGMTAIGFLIIASMVGLIGYGAIRLVPVYLTQMKIRTMLNGLKAEYDGNNPSPQAIQKAITRRLDIDMIDYPSVRDFVIAKSEEGLTVGVAYADSVPYIANLSLTAEFDNSVEIRR